jgi:outer membrane lipoprotein-sorting protein
MFRAATIPLTLLLLVAGSVFVGGLASAQGPKDLTPEQMAEIAILAVGSRPVLAQIRRNGIERGRVSRIGADGRSEDTRYELRFVRGDKPDKDKFRIDNKTPQSEYSLIFGDGKIFGIINGLPFQPRADATADFLSQQAHSIDALLRYKENESKLASAGKDKHQGIDVHVLDLTDKANRKTRYFLSAKSYRVLWLEYEDTPPGASTPVKYVKRFYDYRIVQNTWVPYRTVLTEDGKQTVETHILTVTFGVKMEDALFQNPEAPSIANP